MALVDSKHFKRKLSEVRAQYLNPELYLIMEDMVGWLKKRQIFPMITETVTTLKEDSERKRISSTHREGRAFDLRTLDWPEITMRDFKTYFENKYGSMGAVSFDTMKPTLLIHHDTGLGEHFHVQLNKNYKVNVPKNLEPQPPVLAVAEGKTKKSTG